MTPDDTTPRDAITGRYVTDEYAAQHPDTTVVEGDETAALRAEVERLTEAIATRRTSGVMRSALTRARAERDEARAALARVEAVVQHHIDIAQGHEHQRPCEARARASLSKEILRVATLKDDRTEAGR